MRFFGVLDRMVVRSVAGPAALAFLIYTFLLLIRPIFNLMEQIFVRGLPALDAIKVVLATVPHVIVLTIPMAYLFGVLIAVGRMNTDNEIIALQAGGISARRLLRPILAFALLLAALNTYFFTQVIPRSSQRLREAKTAMFTSARNIGRIEPNVFHEDFPNLLLYVNDVDAKTNTWRNVLVFDSSSPTQERLTLARRGRIVMGGANSDDQDAVSTGEQGQGDPWLLLEDVKNHEIFRNKPATYRVNRNQRQLLKITTNGDSAVTYSLAIRERNTRELLHFINHRRFPDDPEEKKVDENRLTTDLRAASLEVHRRFAIPAACITFALLALPLGVGTGSGAKGRGFVLSIVVVLIYYIVSNNFELMAMEGKVPPWLGMWFPNIALSLVSFVLMARMGRWLGERGHRAGWVSRIIQRVFRKPRQAGPIRTRTSKVQVTGSFPVKLQKRRYASRFPTLFDRHLTRRLVAPLVLVLVSTSALYVVVDLSGNLDDIAKNDVPLDVVLQYYYNVIPQIVVDVLPMGLMIAVLILLTLLERQRELTAYKSAGISLYRVMLPILLIALVGVSVMWILQESVVHAANRDAIRLHDRIKGRDTTRSYRVSDRLWLQSRDDTTFYNFLRYDSPTSTLVRFTMFRLDENMELRFHLSAPRVRYENGGWIADGGWFRQFYPDGTDEFKKITSAMELSIPESPEYFGQEFRQPSEMSMKDLRAYINELVESGYRPAKLVVRLHQKIAYPVSVLVLVLLALPFGLNRGGKRVTTMQGVALALVLGVGYFVLVALFEKMGEAELVPPMIGAWTPVVLGSLFAINRMSTLRT